MKKIVLIGDSIRMGYDKYVKNALEGTAEVYYPSENCKFAQYVLRFAHDWKSRGEWSSDIDLVHWNAGLWDVLEMFGDGPLSSVEHYSQTIARIDKRLRMLFPNAKIVFATSTAIREHLNSKTCFRRNAVIEQFNKAAIEALSGTDTLINDLYAATVNIPEECCSDLTHYNTPAGAAYMGSKVLNVICRTLDISASSINVENFKLENYTADNIGY